MELSLHVAWRCNYNSFIFCCRFRSLPVRKCLRQSRSARCARKDILTLTLSAQVFWTCLNYLNCVDIRSDVTKVKLKYWNVKEDESHTMPHWPLLSRECLFLLAIGICALRLSDARNFQREKSNAIGCEHVSHASTCRFSCVICHSILPRPIDQVKSHMFVFAQRIYSCAIPQTTSNIIVHPRPVIYYSIIAASRFCSHSPFTEGEGLSDNWYLLFDERWLTSDGPKIIQIDVCAVSRSPIH